MRVAPLRCTHQATKESTMKKLITVMALALAGLSSTAYAADSGCAAKAGEKKLAGAAKNSFMKKCEREAGGAGAAQNACDAKAAEKKLAGAAKNSFVKKCVKDAG
jgi:hypothetical protein